MYEQRCSNDVRQSNYQRLNSANEVLCKTLYPLLQALTLTTTVPYRAAGEESQKADDAAVALLNSAEAQTRETGQGRGRINSSADSNDSGVAVDAPRPPQRGQSFFSRERFWNYT